MQQRSNDNSGSSQQAGSTQGSSQGSPGGSQQPAMNPGDEAPPGTPGTAEDICPVCNGSGKADSGQCQNCGGSGRIIEGIGGG